MQTETLADFSREEKLKEIAREIAFRRNVYRGSGRDGKPYSEQAQRRIAIMLAIAKDYGGHGDQR